jgi:5-methylcytosine-specific restriction endonuclease McrA
MPVAAIGYCPTPGCSTRSQGLCSQHRTARAATYQAKVPALHTQRWRRYSRQRLAQFPWCVGYPSGQHREAARLAECTDHILPARAYPELVWEPTNHQSLCHDCNRRKAIAEEGGFGR